MRKTIRIIVAAASVALLVAGAGCVTSDAGYDAARSSPGADETTAGVPAQCAPAEMPETQAAAQPESSARVDVLMARARHMRSERRFEEAISVLGEVLRIDPNNARARRQLEIASDYLACLEDSDAQLALDWSQRTPIIAPEEKPGIWTWYGMWPRDWLELTQPHAAPGRDSSPERNCSQENSEPGTQNGVE